MIDEWIEEEQAYGLKWGKAPKSSGEKNMLNLGRKLLDDFTITSDTLRESAAL